MTELDFLFWLFVALLGGLGYAVEAGLASQHRGLVLSTMASLTLASVYLMFAVDDTMSMETTQPVAQNPDGGGDDDEVAAADLGRGRKKGAKAVAGNMPAGQGKGRDHGLHERDTLKGPFADCAGCPTMVVVRAETFTMGSPDTEEGRSSTEGPQRTIRIGEDFAIGQLEVTRDQFEAFLNESGYGPSRGCEVGGRRSITYRWDNPGFAQTGKHPVVCVSWHDARQYVAWLKKKTGKPYRLPSEAEWELAARAGTSTAYSFGPEFVPSLANAGRQRTGTMPAGESGSNRFGLADMHGNVWELLDDCWSPNLADLPANGRPLAVLGDCDQRAIRGGAWDSPPEHARSATRGAAGVAAALNSVGFRVARDLVALTQLGPAKTGSPASLVPK